MPSIPASEAIRECLEGSLRELFLEYSLEVLQVAPCAPPGDQPEQQLAAIIGFTAERYVGSLVLVCHRDLVVTTLPPELARTPRLIRDWLGELSNQLLGRAKNRMLAFGSSFRLSPPTTLSGRELILESSEGTTTWFKVTTGQGVFEYALDFRAAPDLCFERTETDVPAEGDVFLF